MKLSVIALVCLVAVVLAEDSTINIYNDCCSCESRKGSKGGLVAFSMGSSKHVAVTSQIIPLEIAIFNEGGHFNMTDNTFYTPQDGVYSFSFSGMGSEPDNMSLHLYRQKGNAPKDQLARAGDYNAPGAHGASGGSGATIIVRLEKGEKISLWAGGKLYGDPTNDWYGPTTLFSGMLVSQ